MNCKTCEYPLWNLAARQCPECGAPFKPSDFEFALNSVRFCCPHCNQAYYGTGNKGHLVPAAFECVACHKPVAMDEMTLLPTAGVQEVQTRAEEMPWIIRKRTGRITAWFRTIGKAMGDPARLILLTPENQPVAEALRFATITNFIYFSTGFAVFFVPSFVFGLLGVSGMGTGAAAAASILGSILLMISLASGIVVIWAACTHMLLLITGPVTAPFNRTVHAIGYSSGANILTGVPCFGFLLYPLFAIWWVIAAGFMLQAGHKLRPWRAVVAIAIPPILMCIVGVGIVGLAQWRRTTIAVTAATTAAARQQAAVNAAMANQAGPPAPPPRGTRSSAPVLSGAMNIYMQMHDGAFPAHGLLLSADGPALADSYFLPGSSSDTLVPGVAIKEFVELDPETAKGWARALGEALPQGTVAHRVGDMVFTYHGMGANPAEGLWLAVEAPLEPAPGATVHVVLPGGASKRIAESLFGAEFVRQNELRAVHKLPPLPDPRTVGLEKPAPASDHKP